MTIENGTMIVDSAASFNALLDHPNFKATDFGTDAPTVVWPVADGSVVNDFSNTGLNVLQTKITHPDGRKKNKTITYVERAEEPTSGCNSVHIRNFVFVPSYGLCASAAFVPRPALRQKAITMTAGSNAESQALVGFGIENHAGKLDKLKSGGWESETDAVGHELDEEAGIKQSNFLIVPELSGIMASKDSGIASTCGTYFTTVSAYDRSAKQHDGETLIPVLVPISKLNAFQYNAVSRGAIPDTAFLDTVDMAKTMDSGVVLWLSDVSQQLTARAEGRETASASESITNGRSLSRFLASSGQSVDKFSSTW